MTDKKRAPQSNAGRIAFSDTLGLPELAALREAATKLPRAKNAVWIGPAPLWADGTAFGIWADRAGSPLDGNIRSDLEAAFAKDALDDTTLLNRARDGLEWWRISQIYKFSGHLDEISLPDVPYVLFLDQPKSDDAFPEGANSTALLREILVFARTEVLNAHVVILTAQDGHFTADDRNDNITVLPYTANPWVALDRATAVYTHSASEGFAAILAGHKPRVFGQPWYAGWGLTQDENPSPYRNRTLTRAQLFAAAMINAAIWIDPETGKECTFETAMASAEARHRAAREDSAGYVMTGLARWKHRHMRRYFGRTQVTITNSPKTIDQARADGARHMAWGAKTQADLRVEDGFLRSKGLGAALVPPVSLVCDDLGIYFAPSAPSRLEHLIAQRAALPDYAARRIRNFRTRLNGLGLSKYNTGTPTLPPLPAGEKVLVVGQVEDDASIRLGAGNIATNAALLDAARAAHPDATIIFKPHPDVEKGLRRGDVAKLETMADLTLRDTDPLALIDACDRVWTMTSLMGFEALLRGTPVTTTGAPFYAGWGLTEDRGRVPARRVARPTLDALAHAALIDYPRYFDPRSGSPISPERALDLLASQQPLRSETALSALSILLKLRDLFKRRD